MLTASKSTTLILVFVTQDTGIPAIHVLQSILVMMTLMAVTVMQTAFILDLARIIAHVQQVIEEMELCA